jgi:hypothetical protein
MKHTIILQPPHECVGQAWTEAISILNVEAAKLRLSAAEAVHDVRTDPAGQYGAAGARYDELMARAGRLDELADYLRVYPHLPRDKRTPTTTSPPSSTPL